MVTMWRDTVDEVRRDGPVTRELAGVVRQTIGSSEIAAHRQPRNGRGKTFALWNAASVNRSEAETIYDAGQVFGGYHALPEPAPIELVCDLVLGAAEYGHGLGFAPHPDFEHARAHLGTWTAPGAITFGCDGKPTYAEGPYDDSEHVVRTLRRAVGRDGFHYTVGLDVDERRRSG
jgi:hypothetical protein